MIIDVFTLFPAMFTGPLTESILAQAQANELLTVALHDIRDPALDKHHITDLPPYGGGGGMLMKVEPVVAAVEQVTRHAPSPVILLTPQGRLFTQQIAHDLAQLPRFSLICGHYEGIDERVRQLVVTDELSIGDYVLTGGELPAMVIIDAVARYLPGVLGKINAAEDDSHASGLLEYAQYAPPAVFHDLQVPAVLQSGNHGAIATWRRLDALRRTWHARPDLLRNVPLSETEKQFLTSLARETIIQHNIDTTSAPVIPIAVIDQPQGEQ